MKGFHADVYESLKDSTDYEVVIGSQLTLERATELLNIAKRAGFGTKGYTWSFR
jgi:cell division protein FtsN